MLVIDKAASKLRRVGSVIQERLAMVAAIAQEALSSIKIVRSFATEEEEYKRFEEESNLHFKALMKGTQVRGILEGFVEVILIAALALILWIGGRSVIAGSLTAGGLIAFCTYVGLLVQPVRVLSRVVSTIQQGVASADRVFEILDEANEVPLAENPITHPKMEGRVVFEDVRFSYDESKPVLKDINFEIKPGEKIAIVGPTGAGKSTIADLVMRFYDPQWGAIKIDGIDLRDLELKSYRRQIGVVPQDPVLMKGTLAYNISYGFKGATRDDLVRAAKIAGIYDFIATLPKGFDTEVGERGVASSVRRFDPTLCYMFEGCPADDTFGIEADMQARIKQGPMFRYADCCMITNPLYQRFVLGVAAEEGIPAQGSVREGGGTDGGVAHVMANGIPCVVSGVPSRYIHAGCAIASLDDVENAARLCVSALSKLTVEEAAKF